MNDRLPPASDLNTRAIAHFRAMVESVGVKRFAAALGLSTRQVNRILSGVQPNPVERLVKSLQSCSPEVGDRALDFVCQEAGGFFVRQEASIDSAAANAVRECAEAIAGISDGEISELDEREIREAIGALVSLLKVTSEARARGEAPRFSSTMAAPAPGRPMAAVNGKAQR
ncbi:MAG: hypothetical protein J0L61_12925 [Planctomycetes bacterium]|nr:hypothetical protein [Planctomycetota bacterium]